MTAETDDDAGPPGGGSPLTVDLAIDEAELARRVGVMLADAPDIVVVGGDWPAAQVRITAGTAEVAGSTCALFLSRCVADQPPAVAGVVSAQIDAAALCAAIRATAHGLAVFSPRFRSPDIEERDTAGLASAEDEHMRVDLTPRELQVLQLLAEGASNKVIARRLAITPHTAKFHVASIIGKLGATGRTDAVARAMRLGLVMI